MHTDIVIAELNDRNPNAVLFDNMNQALVGIGNVAHHDPIAIYSKRKIFEKLLHDGFSDEDAEEYFAKFSGTWAGENTPVIIDDILEQ